ncbi:malate dehydrogenase (quinone) [Portibacter lacus]|uniref:Probable malate:quinone oxidoreductase n=1 Tax=Portibacter lacus TaxID=1099794 RepID=A0AA37WDE2_9BACT|nr:malate dehydrogenase (quinone) [Portibacter lacus]GLR15867.1 putative malate:quinone oxidoreductase [Portibacter lacus]
MNILESKKNIVLIGAGIMSATLGVLIKKLIPDAKIDIYERLDQVGAERSDAWNNAGTGHSAFCELNYTPIDENGEVDISKALRIAEQFEISKQFWAYLKQHDHLDPQKGFINDIDHMSFVWGEKNVDFLKKRYASMTKYAIFEDMLYSEDYNQIKKWVPLMMEGRAEDEVIAATRMAIGTDVNFGEITRGMISWLDQIDGVNVHMGHHINEIQEQDSGWWKIDMKDLNTKEYKSTYADFVFIGAGGGSLTLLEKTDIPEARGYGGFPVSGQWLRCTNQEVIKKHEAKVYGKAAVGSPPMSVPHLDTRIINGERCLLFGPYAGFSTKFLKEGSYLDLFLSIEMHNVWPMMRAGMKNIQLTKYLVNQVMQSQEDRFEFLKLYYPEAKFEDWELAVAGQRVQIIKKDKEEGGALKFGTEIVKNESGSLAALLGASPGASTSVSIMLDVIKQCFPENHQSAHWQKTLKEIIPCYGSSLIENGELCKKMRAESTRILKLEDQDKKAKQH